MTVYTPVGGGGGGGGGAYTVQNITTNTTLVGAGNKIINADSGGGGITVTLPLSSTNTGSTIIVRRTTNNGSNVTVVPQGTDTIDGDASRPLNYSPGGEAYPGNQWLTCVVTSTGTGYMDNQNNMLIAGGIHGIPGRFLSLTGDGSLPGQLSFAFGAGGYLQVPPNTSSAFQIACGVQLGNGAGISPGSIWGGSGVPPGGTGANGDFWFRTDTPGTALQRVYVKAAGAWTGVV